MPDPRNLTSEGRSESPRDVVLRLLSKRQTHTRTAPHFAGQHRRALDADQLNGFQEQKPGFGRRRAASLRYEGHVRPRSAFTYFDKGVRHKTLLLLTVGIVARFRDDLRAAGVFVPSARKILATLQIMLGDAIGLDVGVRRRKHILEQTLVLQVHALPNNAKEQD